MDKAEPPPWQNFLWLYVLLSLIFPTRNSGSLTIYQSFIMYTVCSTLGLFTPYCYCAPWSCFPTIPSAMCPFPLSLHCQCKKSVHITSCLKVAGFPTLWWIKSVTKLYTVRHSSHWTVLPHGLSLSLSPVPISHPTPLRLRGANQVSLLYFNFCVWRGRMHPFWLCQRRFFLS